jgi:abortive infection bacteriophage resistance protein
VFLKVLGKESRDIYLQGNDFRKAKVLYRLDKDIRSEVVRTLDNIPPSR